MKDRVQKEAEYHDKRFEDEKGRAGVRKFYTITDSSKAFYKNFLRTHCNKKAVLEYGCGTGSNIGLLLDNGASVTGIDISRVAIEKATQQFIGVSSAKLSLQVMNAEELEFLNDSFDLICGTGILHHLNLANAFKELSRTLKPDGVAIFVEPLGHNPLINLYRKMTPDYRTEDEHPLIQRDFQILKSYFQKVELNYFHLCTIFAVPFRKTKIFNLLSTALNKLDQFLFKTLPGISKYAWQVVIILHK